MINCDVENESECTGASGKNPAALLTPHLPVH